MYLWELGRQGHPIPGPQVSVPPAAAAAPEAPPASAPSPAADAAASDPGLQRGALAGAVAAASAAAEVQGDGADAGAGTADPPAHRSPPSAAAAAGPAPSPAGPAPSSADGARSGSTPPDCEQPEATVGSPGRSKRQRIKQKLRRCGGPRSHGIFSQRASCGRACTAAATRAPPLSHRPAQARARSGFVHDDS